MRACEVLRDCNKAVLIGTNAYYNDVYNVDRDTDIAVDYKDYMDNHVSGKFEAHRDSESLEYVRSNETLWTAVEKLTFSDGSSLDIVFYDSKYLDAVQTTMHMMLTNGIIWLPECKEIRVETFGFLVYNLYKMKKIKKTK